jgi:hypothetical protein
MRRRTVRRMCRRSKDKSGFICGLKRRDFTIKPILLFRQRAPCRLHALVSLVGWIVSSALSKLGAIFRVFEKVLRLLHGVLLYRKNVGSEELRSIGIL